MLTLPGQRIWLNFYRIRRENMPEGSQLQRWSSSEWDNHTGREDRGEEDVEGDQRYDYAEARGLDAEESITELEDEEASGRGDEAGRRYLE
ncbi:uncharacterized protein PAC_03748 [Phialocephala subalpina]|uniref:Uncharacterized protein n=1 Tax=Phialocephala subalpina TaxID=576137 RepID=A0A1L7WM87_9HELO|nr:uncharacterized protein PAC_03748 [Phialocephala subalpina]